LEKLIDLLSKEVLGILIDFAFENFITEIHPKLKRALTQP
jgi:hypothetical protein